MTDTQNLAGKTIVITGASSGFGRGAAQRLGQLGANVVIAARRADALNELGAEIAASGGHALPVTADVADPAAIADLARAAVERFGRIDVWVNNAGVGAMGFFWDIPVEDHARIVDVNLKGLIYGAHAALRQFRAQGSGILVNVGSIDSEVPLAYQSSYAASKAAVLSLSRTLNEELRIAGLDQTISVGTIMPWAVDTPWWTHAANYTGHALRMAAMDDPAIVVDAIVAACTDPKEEQPVGPKARGANLSHRLFPDLTERFSAKVVDVETERGHPAPHTVGAIYEPMAGTTTVDGGIRERMRREDGERRR
ncbi:SDR family NAD(P)-dependent oxidoreductase [Microbacterium sp. NPDC096154]|uniref:SDR family NAD(P)-dependent oxidoreductase n=1 Tax=Microbacterium sp. NPDC096154 TaxID=3155549 RepID=UPI003316DCC0